MDVTRYIKKPSRLLIAIGSRFPFLISDESYLKIIFKEMVGYPLDLEKPNSFNEKLQWLKIYDHNYNYINLVDKYEVKKWVSKRAGSEYVIPTIGVWERFEDIDFSKLPDRFVLKCTHDSGGVFLCQDKSKIDYISLKKQFVEKLKYNFYGYGREWPYKKIRPRIIGEELLIPDDRSNHGILMDYKFMCFNGEVKCIFVCTGRYSYDGLHVTFFDTNWNRMPFERKYPSDSKEIKMPDSLFRMVSLAQELSKGIPFVRVDLYDANKSIYFGEMTFYPGSGFEPFYPQEWDYIMGEWLDISAIFNK